MAAPSTPASQGSAVSGANNIVCICQVCECGQHRCRLLEAQAHYDDINTMYQAHYPWHPTQQRAVVREQKPYLRTAHDPQHFRTNYGASFVEHAVRQESVRPKSAPPVKTKFSHKSTYQVEHGDKGVQNRMSKKRGDVRPVKVPFTHKSTNQTDFVQVAAEKRHLLRPPSSAVPNTSFNGTSTYGVAFKPYEAAGATRAKRSAALHVLPEDRDFLSMKQASYTQPPLSLCPAASLAKTSAPKSGHTQLRMSEGGKKVCVIYGFNFSGQRRGFLTPRSCSHFHHPHNKTFRVGSMRETEFTSTPV